MRVDAVASMLYLDYSRKPGEWIPNVFGGRENLEAIAFIKRLNEEVHGRHPGVVMIAEESTAWPAVSRPVYLGGLGFTLKWNMGWMHDMLSFIEQDPIHRKFHFGQLTFALLYAFHENFVLPFSHDEVVHMKRSMLDKMPGDLWKKFANLRLLYSYMYAHPGKKLLFMGGEIAQWEEWNHDASLQWHLLQWDKHQGIQRFVRELNRVYRETPAALRAGLPARGVRVDRFPRRGQLDRLPAAPREGPERLRRLRLQLHPGAERGIPRRRPVRRPLPGGDEQRRRRLRWAATWGTAARSNRKGSPGWAVPYSVCLTLPPLGALFLLPEREASREMDPESPDSVNPVLNGAIASTFQAMRHRNFRLWFIGQLISLIGTWMQTIAQNWLVYELTGSAADLGLVNFVGAVPLVLLTLYAGVIADRFDKRRVVFWCQAAMMLLAFILALLCWTGVVRLWHVLLLAFLLGTAMAIDTPARQSFVVELVGKEDLSNAIALNSSIFHGARVVGPAAAGVLVAVSGRGGARSS